MKATIHTIPELGIPSLGAQNQQPSLPNRTADQDSDLGRRLTQYAHKLLDESAEQPFDVQTETFKIVAQFWLGSTKRGGKSEPERESEAVSFDAFRRKVADASG